MAHPESLLTLTLAQLPHLGNGHNSLASALREFSTPHSQPHAQGPRCRGPSKVRSVGWGGAGPARTAVKQGLPSPQPSAGQTPRKMRHAYDSELLDVYCSQCCKKINLLNDLEARLKNLKANRWGPRPGVGAGGRRGPAGEAAGRGAPGRRAGEGTQNRAGPRGLCVSVTGKPGRRPFGGPERGSPCASVSAARAG